MDIERLRALGKAVELVAKATHGPWAFMNEKFDDCLLAFGTDTLDHDAPPPWYSCWTSINPDDGRALIAAVNFIREHGSALIAELGQEVGAVESFRGSLNSWIMAYPEQCFSEPQPEELFWLRDAKPGLLDRISASMGRHVAKCLINDFDAAFSNFTTSPAHTSEARDAARCYSIDGDSWHDCPDDAYFVGGRSVGDEFTLEESYWSRPVRFRVTKVPDGVNDDYEVERVDAAMRQEGGSRDLQR